MPKSRSLVHSLSERVSERVNEWASGPNQTNADLSFYFGVPSANPNYSSQILSHYKSLIFAAVIFGLSQEVKPRPLDGSFLSLPLRTNKSAFMAL